MMSADVFLKLKKSGHRLSKSRKSLIEFVLATEGHWTIQTLYERVRRPYPRVGMATLYRTVALLHNEKLLSETRFGGGPARFEVSSRTHHDHLTCLDCHEIFEFENDRIEELQKSMAKKLGFKLSDHRMELFGNCQRSSCPHKKRRRA